MNAWKHLAQAHHGPELVYQAGKAFASYGQWPVVALVQKQGSHARVIAGSVHGSPLPQLEYSLSQAPCAALYRSKPSFDSLIYSTQPEKFIHWPLTKQFIWQTYFAHHIDVPEQLGQFHLFALAQDPHPRTELPKDLLLTSCQRIAASLIQHAEHTELQALRQMQQAQPTAFARLCPLGRLHQISGSLALLLQRSFAPFEPLPFTEVVQLNSNEALAHLLTQQQTSSHYCTLLPADGNNIEQVLSLTPISSQLGFMATFSDPTSSEASTRLAPTQQAQQNQLLHQRIEQELARIRRNQQVAALFFIKPANSSLTQPQWQQLKQKLNALFRQEDLLVQPTEQTLTLLTACFDHQGQAPQQQMNVMADKLHRTLCQTEPNTQWQLNTRLLTQWDHGLERALDLSQATLWQPHSVT